MSKPRRKRIPKVRFASGLYNVSFESLYGVCIRPAGDHPEIVVDPRQTEQELMDSLIHEGIHAERVNMPESQVYPLAHSLARLLWACGYRRIR